MILTGLLQEKQKPRRKPSPLRFGMLKLPKRKGIFYGKKPLANTAFGLLLPFPAGPKNQGGTAKKPPIFSGGGKPSKEGMTKP